MKKRKIEDIQIYLEKGLKAQGATHVGFANLAPLLQQNNFVPSPVYQDLIERYSYGISIGFGLSKDIVAMLKDLDNHAVSQTYHFHCYTAIGPRLDSFALWVTSVLQQEGYQALPIPSSQYKFKDFNDELRAVFPHKSAAHLAGLGWIGKNCLLVTEDFGPAIRLVTVLTNAPFATGTVMDSKCGDCTKCIDICPPKALRGVSFNPQEDRDARIEVWKCDEFREEREKEMGNRSCGLCIYACPYVWYNTENDPTEIGNKEKPNL